MAPIRPLHIVLLAFSLTVAVAPAQDLDDAVQRLAQHFGIRRPIALTWQNISTMPADEAGRARQRFESAFELSATGIESKATRSENQRGYLIVLQTADGRVFAEGWSRPPARPVKPPFRLKQTKLGDSPRPILDAAISPDGQRIVLLESFRVSSGDRRPVGSWA